MNMNEVKRMNIKEFRENGYLQELNRQFLHPLGLALEAMIDENGEEKLGGVWDYRDDPEGLYYNLRNSDKSRIERFRKNAEFMDSLFITKENYREKNLGFFIEPNIKGSK